MSNSFSHLCKIANQITNENERWQTLYSILLNEERYVSNDDAKRCYSLNVNGVEIKNIEAMNLIMQGIKQEAISIGHGILESIKDIKSAKLCNQEIHDTLGFLGENSWDIIESNKSIIEEG